MPEPNLPVGIPEHTLSVLEFGKILPEVARRADSAWGRELAVQIAPAPDLHAAQVRMAALAEWLRLEQGDPRPPSLALPDIRPALDRAETPGAVLDARELLDVAVVAQRSRETRSVLDVRAADAPCVTMDVAPRLVQFVPLEQSIRHAIDERGLVRDDASPLLAKLRRRIESTRVEIAGRLERLAGRIGAESFVTQRGGRHTVAVPVEWLDRVRGIVHDRSASGATVFLEPFEAIELGNRLRADEEEERAEVRRILTELTARAGEVAPSLRDAAAALAELDLLRAKSRLHRDWDCVLPELRLGGPIDLKSGRHPLLARARAAQSESVVPLTLALGDPGRILVVTGPNMGGKTVALKTLGLITLMAMAGLGAPAAEGTVLGFFPRIVADIGDEQSIEENLSTFASHVRHLCDAIETASPHALVLLDELGAGTDPAEGAALGQAVLETLATSGAIAIVTTHHGALKGMAMSNPSIVNASMAFDPSSHAPLYLLIPGVPGRSLGIEVAERLGFPDALLARARALVPEDEQHLGELIADVERRRLALASAEGELAQTRARLAELVGKYRRRLEDARGLRDQVLERAREQAERVLSEADELVRSARRTLRLAGARGQGGPSPEAPGEPAPGAAGADLGREIEALAGHLREARSLQGTEPAGGVPPALIEPGDRLWAIDLGAVVEVLAAPDHAGRVRVRHGGFKLEIGTDRLRPATAADLAAAKPEKRLPAAQVEVEAPAGMEIDLRGLTGDEAVAAVERFLEQATVHGLRLVRIIHGKGTGALRARVQELLRAHPRVITFRLGETGEGGAGVTVAEIG